jgi:ABC-type dipeptide/oligopeptide/nickel transport system permease subunit
MKKIILLTLFLVMLFIVFQGESDKTWSTASFRHPLGTDEFGRDMLAVCSAAILISILKGFALGLLAMSLGIMCGYLTVFSKSIIFRKFIELSLLCLESIPLMLWIMVIVTILPMPKFILIFAFPLGTLPIVSRVATGEMERLKTQPFVEASRLCGASNLSCTFRHILPNAMSVLTPLGVQLSGSGAAADGLFGLVGLGNRIHLDVGTLLLRGKENALLHPELIVIAVISIAVLFFYFWFVYSSISNRTAYIETYL